MDVLTLRLQQEMEHPQGHRNYSVILSHKGIPLLFGWEQI